MTDRPEMAVEGNYDGTVVIGCYRKGCQNSLGIALYIDVPDPATPKVIDELWHQHRLDHANKEK